MAETDYVLSENKCLECGGDIYAKAKNDGTARKKNYCSDKCIARAHWKREGRNIGTRTMLEIQRESIAKNTHTCEQCGDQYLNERRHPVCGIRFCSRQCNDIYRKNKSIIRKELEDGDKCTIHYHSCVDCGNQIPGYTKGHRKDPRCSDCEAISNEAKTVA